MTGVIPNRYIMIVTGMTGDGQSVESRSSFDQNEFALAWQTFATFINYCCSTTDGYISHHGLPFPVTTEIGEVRLVRIDSAGAGLVTLAEFQAHHLYITPMIAETAEANA